MLNEHELQYHNLLEEVLECGKKNIDRTGTGTLSLFRPTTMQFYIDGGDNFPLFTKKFVNFKAIVKELLWFLSGSNNINDLDSNIWNEWTQISTEYPTNDRLKGYVKIREYDGEEEFTGTVATKHLKLNFKRGGIDCKLVGIWKNMINRCYNRDAHNYHLYGGLGIRVCKKWHDVVNFIKDVKEIINWDNKLKHWNEYELDKDYYASKTYSKNTCVWLSSKENNLYTKSTNPFELHINDKKYVCMSYSDAEKQTGLKRSSIHRWFNEGISKKNDLKYRELNIKITPIEKREGYVFRYKFTNGSLGNLYGSHFRKINGQDPYMDIIKEIKEDPHSRRHCMSTWRKEWIPERGISFTDNIKNGKASLAPCHGSFTMFYVNEENELDMSTIQRSCDLFIGGFFNIPSYALLLMITAKLTGYKAGTVYYDIGNAHIYKNHIQQVKEYLARPFLHNSPSVTIDNCEGIPTFDNIHLFNYQYQGKIKAPIAI